MYMLCCLFRDDSSPVYATVHDRQVIQLQELPGELPAILYCVVCNNVLSTDHDE